LLLAMGAEPRRPTFKGAGLPQVHVLRSLADCQAIIAGAKSARRVVVLGSSFIGLEAAASLRERGLEVDVVSQDTAPMERVFGPEVAGAVVHVHEKHGVRLHLGREIASFEGTSVALDDGAELQADLLLVGIGVTPRLKLAETAGLKVDHGVLVDKFLQTSDPAVSAAGDIAAWLDPHSGERLRVEHWNVAVRQGQVAAQNMLGMQHPFADVPFFWTKQFDFSLQYLGHAKEWDEIRIDGDVEKWDCTVRYLLKGQVMATVMIGRDWACLEERERMERTVTKR
jgi:NADPH-dependent 2,4-dienoyl-CoA reductase/sulfur reductase-like enzyme